MVYDLIDINELLTLKEDINWFALHCYFTKIDPTKSHRVAAHTVRQLTCPALSNFPDKVMLYTNMSQKSEEGKTPLFDQTSFLWSLTMQHSSGSSHTTNTTYLMCQNIDIMANIFWGDAIITILLLMVTFKALVIRILHHIHL